MSSVAETFVHVVGVDTHAKTHTYAIIAATGAMIETRVFPADGKGITRAISWISKCTDASRLVVIEGAGSYGARLAHQATQAGWQIVEADPIPKIVKRGKGKTDVLDATRIARSVLGTPTAKLRQPRFDNGVRDGLRILLNARQSQHSERTRAINQLNALIRNTDLGIEALNALTCTQIRTIAGWRTRNEPMNLETARQDAIRLARRIRQLDTDLKTNHKRLTEIINTTSYQILFTRYGIGAVSAAQIIISWGHLGRITSDASFAALGGINPIPTSSGNTTKHRLNRGGDRQLNKALDTIAKVRMRSHPETLTYMTKRTDLTHRETKRILKRYIAREIYKLLKDLPQPHQH